MCTGGSSDRGRRRRPPRRCAPGSGSRARRHRSRRPPRPGPAAPSPWRRRPASPIRRSPRVVQRRVVRNHVTRGTPFRSGAGRVTCCHSDRPQPDRVAHPPAPAPRRRSLRLRAVQGAFRAARCRRRRRDLRDGYVAPAAARQAARRCRAGRARRPLRPSGGMGDRARQRRHDRVLGRRHVRARGAPQRAPRVRRVLVKFAEACAAAPHLDDPVLVSSDPGDHPDAVADATVDVYAFTHNETSTGVAMDLRRPERSDGALVAVDATSGAGGLPWDPAHVDVYYFAPQKCFAADGGLWVAACSPAAVERIERIAASDRWRPASLDLGIALTNSRQDQTYNTPAVATLIMFEAQLRWMLGSGGLDWCVKRSCSSSEHLYSWAEQRSWATPFVADPAKRSAVVGTIDLDDSIDATKVSARAAGERHRRHRQLPQAGPQPAAHRDVPGHRPGRCRGLDGEHRPPRRAPRRVAPA